MKKKPKWVGRKKNLVRKIKRARKIHPITPLDQRYMQRLSSENEIYRRALRDVCEPPTFDALSDSTWVTMAKVFSERMIIAQRALAETR